MTARDLLSTVATLVLLASIPGVAWSSWTSDPSLNTPVCTDTGSQLYGLANGLVEDGSGGFFTAWHDRRSGSNYDIYVQHLDANGDPLWTAGGVPVCTATGDQNDPSVVTDGAGGCIVAWYDRRTTYRDVYAQRLDPSGTAQWTANGKLVCGASLDQKHPNIISDGAGGAFIAWDDLRNVGSLDRGYIQRIDSDGDPYWTVDGIEVAVGVDPCYVKALIADGSGNALLLCGDGSLGLFAQRIDANGTRPWGTTGTPVCPGGTANSAAVSDGAGGMIAAWSDNRDLATTRYDIYAQRVTAAGTAAWTASGIPVTTADRDQDNPYACADGAGGAVIAWADQRNGSNDDDVYAQRVDGSGTLLWGAPAVSVAVVDSSDQRVGSLVADGSGGAFIQWTHQLLGCLPANCDDVYSQHVAGLDGAPQWAASGVAVSTAIERQFTVRSIPDGQGGIIVAWTDYRPYDGGAGPFEADLYAQHVNGDGSLGASGSVAVPEITHAAEWTIEPARPNPFRTGTTVSFHVPAGSRVVCSVHDVSGRRIRTLLDGPRTAGSGELTWDGRDASGAAVPAGVYFLRLVNDSEVQSVRAIRLR